MQHLITFLNLPDTNTPPSILWPSSTLRAREKLAAGWKHLYVFRELWAGAMLTIVGFGLLAMVGPGSAIASQYVAQVPYCEAVSGGLFAQPVNTVSNLAYSLSGLVILHVVGQDRASGKGSTERAILSQMFGWIALLQGFTSAAFHGTLTHWGGISDNIAMNLLVSLVLVYNIVRLRGGTMRTFGLLYGALNASTTAYLLHDDSGSLRLFAVLVVGAVLSECVLLAPCSFSWIRNRIRRSRPEHLGGAVASFAVGWVTWRLSDTAGPLCAPNGVLQGHAAWHVFTSLTILSLCIYFRSESAQGESNSPCPRPEDPRGLCAMPSGHLHEA